MNVSGFAFLTRLTNMRVLHKIIIKDKAGIPIVGQGITLFLRDGVIYHRAKSIRGAQCPRSACRTALIYIFRGSLWA